MGQLAQRVPLRLLRGQGGVEHGVNHQVEHLAEESDLGVAAAQEDPGLVVDEQQEDAALARWWCEVDPPARRPSLTAGVTGPTGRA